ncbi:hypothetical protein KAU85_01470 [Candidatus Bathyarchaeota archaeon]|nr:hypothetical protein [Candidatus Bathyarchaeota archaeon]
MSGDGNRGLLSIGIFLIILVVSIILCTPLGLIDWSLVPPLILALYGCWTIALAGIRASNPQKYERGPFSTFAGGLILIAVGGAWFLWSFGWLYSLVILLLVLGVLAIVTALKRK